MTNKLLSGLLLALMFASCSEKDSQKRILVFSKTAGYRHESIAAGKQALLKMGTENNWVVDTTEDASVFNEDNLKQYAAVIFLNTTLNVLDYSQETSFERYIQAGGGFTAFMLPLIQSMIGCGMQD